MTVWQEELTDLYVLMLKHNIEPINIVRQLGKDGSYYLYYIEIKGAPQDFLVLKGYEKL